VINKHQAAPQGRDSCHINSTHPNHVGWCSSVHNFRPSTIATDGCTNANPRKARIGRYKSLRRRPSTSLFTPGMTGWPERRANAWGKHNARCSHLSERSAHPSQSGDPITRGNSVVILVTTMCRRARRKRNQRGRTWPGSEVGAGTATMRRSFLMMPITIRIVKVIAATLAYDKQSC
jgi:hypothetical protein